jgi:hypothetical protein
MWGYIGAMFGGDDWLAKAIRDAFVLPTGAARNSPALEEEIKRVLSLASQAWSGVYVELAVFLRFLAKRMQNVQCVGDALGRLHTDDLYLALACSEGSSAAIVHFDEKLETVVRPWITRQHRERGNTNASLERVALASLEDAACDPEMAHLKSRYLEQFRHAFRQAILDLSVRNRLVMRYHLIDRLSIDVTERHLTEQERAALGFLREVPGGLSAAQNVEGGEKGCQDQQQQLFQCSLAWRCSSRRRPRPPGAKFRGPPTERSRRWCQPIGSRAIAPIRRSSFSMFGPMNCMRSGTSPAR